jgi:hypothetical protein
VRPFSILRKSRNLGEEKKVETSEIEKNKST